MWTLAVVVSGMRDSCIWCTSLGPPRTQRVHLPSPTGWDTEARLAFLVYKNVQGGTFWLDLSGRASGAPHCSVLHLCVW